MPAAAGRFVYASDVDEQMNDRHIIFPDKCKEALGRFYDFDVDAMEFLRYSQNYVFRVTDRRGRFLIVRLTEPDHRSREEIVAEICWIEYLKKHGVNACGAVSPEGHDVCEMVRVGERDYFSVIFEHAPGREISGRDLVPELFERHGRLVGRLHRLAMNYVQPQELSRPEWYRSRLYCRDAEQYLLPDQPRVYKVLQDLVAQGMALSREEETFGIVHLDLHYNNFFIEDNELYLFDFDNCARGFYANDVAKALYSSVITYLRREKEFDDSPFESPAVDHAQARVWGPFWKGYQTEHELHPSMFAMLPLFFMLVDIKSYVHHHRHGTPDRHPEIKHAFRKIQERIENGILPVQFDFMEGRPVEHLVKIDI